MTAVPTFWSSPGYTDGSLKPLLDKRMTALIVSFLVWTIVALMAADKDVRAKEKRALVFFGLLGTILTVIGLWRFEVTQIASISLHDWILLGFWPVFGVSLFLRSKLIRLQSKATGNACSMLDLDLAEIPNRNLVRQFRIVNAMMWSYATIIIVMQAGLIVG